MGFAERCGLLQNCISGALGTSDIMYIHTRMLYMYLAYTAPALRLRCASVAFVLCMCCICVVYVLCLHCIWVVFALLSIFLVGTVGPSLQYAWYSNYSRHHDSEHKSCWFVERSAVHMHLDSHVHGLTFKHICPYMGACTCSMYVN